jgi:23S rRNA (adenine2030-N6)-methyltransferase
MSIAIMPYNHAGEIGDIWKHLPICDILAIEKPRRYVETNSAFPFYILPRKPQLDYGIHQLMNHIEEAPVLAESVFYRTLQNLNEKPLKRYLGSPGLSMTILKDIAYQYIYCDLEPEPLAEIHEFAKALGIGNYVKTFQGDSIDYGSRLVPELTEDDFVFLDPYGPFDQNKEGCSFFDLFIALARASIPCAIWYGYDTLHSKAQIASFAKQQFTGVEAEKHRLKGVNVFLKELQAEEVLFNPGVPGCGVIIANLSVQSAEKISVFSKELVKIYKNVRYEGFDGELKADVIDFQT